MKPFLFLLIFSLLLPTIHALAQRQIADLPDGWKFVKHDAPVDLPADSGEWQAVTVPHCYNALDGQNGKKIDGGYYRGPTWYRRTLDIPAEWKDRRVFIRFEGVFLVADVYLNGEKIGEHRGGFAAFCYELTDKLKLGEANELRVRVDNAKNNDVAPLSADFTMEGGIYRPVQLIVTDREHITMRDYAGPGVYVTAKNLPDGSVDVEVETKLEARQGPSAGTEVSLTLRSEIRDADGKRMARKDTSNALGIDDGTTWQQYQITDAQGRPLQTKDAWMAIGTSVKQHLHLDHPHFWSGVKDPYVYTVNVELIRGGEPAIGTVGVLGINLGIIDEVTVPLGFRTVTVDNEKGFLLNGEPYPVHGVNRHQEKQDKGWALSDADHDEDFQIIREMGATAVRLAHYQQAQHVHDLADKTGLLLWEEIPLVNEISDSPAFAENARQQLTEMIRQCSNHPSVLTWSVCNELYNNKTPPVEPLIRSLVALAAELDPTRIPAGVSCHPDKKELAQIPPWIGFNQYPGWYGNNVENFARDAKAAWEAAGGDKRIAITEYGAGANPAQHQEGALTQPKPGGPWHPEEWQSFLHARSWEQARNDPHLWGTFIWAMFDFAVDSRDEGSTPGLNDKGMVTHDRRIKKDTFYFYKANWNLEPMVYVTSRRAVERTLPKTQIKAYTNLPEAELTLNGQSLGKRKPSDIHVLIWPDVTLQPGRNVVEITARAADGKVLGDRSEWTLHEPLATPTPAIIGADSPVPTSTR